MELFLRAISQKNLSEIRDIWLEHQLAHFVNDAKYNKIVFECALETNEEIIDYIISLGFELHYSYLRYLLKKNERADEILEYLFKNCKVSFSAEVYIGILRYCKTYKQVLLILEYSQQRKNGTETLNADVLNFYIRGGKYLLFYEISKNFKINLQEQDLRGNTILHYFDENMPEYKTFILKVKDLSIKNKKGVSAFRALSINTWSTDFLLDGLEKGVLFFDINDECELGRTILHKAAASDDYDRIKKIISLGGDIYHEDHNEIEPIYLMDEDIRDEMKKYYFECSIPDVKGAI